MCLHVCVCVGCVWSYTHDVTCSQGISECLKSRHQDAESLPAAPGGLITLILSPLISFFGPHFHIFVSLQPSSPLRANTNIFKWTFSYPCSRSCCYITGNKMCKYTFCVNTRVFTRDPRRLMYGRLISSYHLVHGPFQNLTLLPLGSKFLNLCLSSVLLGEGTKQTFWKGTNHFKLQKGLLGKRSAPFPSRAPRGRSKRNLTWVVPRQHLP